MYYNTSIFTMDVREQCNYNWNIFEPAVFVIGPKTSFSFEFFYLPYKFWFGRVFRPRLLASAHGIYSFMVGERHYMNITHSSCQQ